MDISIRVSLLKLSKLEPSAQRPMKSGRHHSRSGDPNRCEYRVLTAFNIHFAILLLHIARFGQKYSAFGMSIHGIKCQTHNVQIEWEHTREWEQETLKQTRTRKLHNLNWNCPKPSGFAVVAVVAAAHRRYTFLSAHKNSASISQNSRSIVSNWVIIFANARLIFFVASECICSPDAHK